MVEVDVWGGRRMDRDHIHGPWTILNSIGTESSNFFARLGLRLALVLLKGLKRNKKNYQTAEVNTWGGGRMDRFQK